MKIMVCGKGGSGKTVLSILMAKTLSEKFKIYIVDSDESNTLLSVFLGVNPPKPLIEYVGGKRDEADLERMEPNIVKALSKAREGIRLNLLPSEYVSTSTDDIKLVAIGKVREYGEGCACPFNILARILLGNLHLEKNEVVLIDTDAGIEHVGRRLEEVSDGIVAVVDPTLESLELALLLRKISIGLGKRFWTIANKVTDEVRDLIVEGAAKIGLEIDGFVGFDRDLYISCLRREPIKSSTAISDVKRFAEEKILPAIL